jgi:hypothetical protein
MGISSAEGLVLERGGRERVICKCIQQRSAKLSPPHFERVSDGTEEEG